MKHVIYVAPEDTVVIITDAKQFLTLVNEQIIWLNKQPADAHQRACLDYRRCEIKEVL